MMNSLPYQLVQIRWLLIFFLAGLLLSGLTAIPLPAEINKLVEITGAKVVVEGWSGPTPPAWAVWLVEVQNASHDTAERWPFLFYGTDWLAFGHVVIAISFIGAWRDPVRNVWLINFGLIACGLVVPWALVFGYFRGIPGWWRAIDCSFGMVGAVPLIICKRLVHELVHDPIREAR